VRSYHPRIESKEHSNFITSRSRNSELWFVNNQALTEATLGYLAKFSLRYQAKVYAFAIEGNHIQMPVDFPEDNRSSFMRDFKSCVARSVTRHCPAFKGGTFWGRRYSNEFLPKAPDIEEYFFYTVLQPVNDGLVDKISEFPGYNCFEDAISGIKRKVKVIDWAEYNATKVYKKNVNILDYTEELEFEYSRLPGYENLSQKEYIKLMREKLELHRVESIRKRKERGISQSLGKRRLLLITPGSLPKNSKRSDINSFRPRVLSSCPKRREKCLNWYFNTLKSYYAASLDYRSGNHKALFPQGTYKPYINVNTVTKAN